MPFKNDVVLNISTDFENRHKHHFKTKESALRGQSI